MRKFIWGICLLVGVTLAGCASRSPFEGEWKAQEVPAALEEPGADHVTVFIGRDGSFAGVVDDEKGRGLSGFKGTWTAESENTITFKFEPVEERAVPPSGKAELVEQNTLVGLTGEEDIKFTRQKK